MPSYSTFAQIVAGKFIREVQTAPAEGVGFNGWKNAISNKPMIIPYRQSYKDGPVVDFSKDPIELNYEVIDVSIEERYQQIHHNAALDMQASLVNSSKIMNFDHQIIYDEHAKIDEIFARLQNAKTHEELDDIQGVGEEVSFAKIIIENANIS